MRDVTRSPLAFGSLICPESVLETFHVTVGVELKRALIGIAREGKRRDTTVELVFISLGIKEPRHARLRGMA